MLRTRHLAGAIAALLFSTAASATTFSKVVVFGDSLSDAGNISLASNPAIQPPLEFTTNPGHVAVQGIAGGLGYTLGPSLAGGSDYAWGGAGVLTNSPGTPAVVPTITSQVNAYLAAGATDPNALYSIWGGANDIFYAATAAGAGAKTQALLQQSQAVQIGFLVSNNVVTAAQAAAMTPQQISTTVTQAVLVGAGVSSFMTAGQAQASIGAAAQQEVKLIGQLQSAGVKNILVFNLPNIGVTPDGAAQGAAAQQQLTGLSLVFNNTLNSGLGTLGQGIIPVNTYGLINEVVANPSMYGFSNVTVPACSGTGQLTSVKCGPQGSGLPFTYAAGTDQSYLFADGVHPTTAAHTMLAQVVLAEIAAPGQISLLGEAPLAASAAQTRAIRNQMLADGNGSTTRAFASVDYGYQQFDAQASSPKATSNNVNLTLGVDMQATDNLSAGIALGVGQHNASFNGGGGYKLQDVSGLGYLTWHQGGGYVGGYADFGQSNFSDINRRIAIGAGSRTESGKADGSHLGAGISGGWWFDLGSLRTGPFATAEWQTVKVSGYNEDGNDSTAMWFGRQQRNALIGTLGWRVQGHWQAGGTVLAPYAELAWNHDGKADPRAVTAGLTSMNGSFALTGYAPASTWGTADLGLSAQFSQALSGWVGYSGRFGDNSQKYNSVNLGVKYAF